MRHRVLLTALVAPALATAQGPGAARPGSLRALDPADLASWNSIRSTATSWDGKWFAYVVAPNEGDGSVKLRSTGADAVEKTWPIGEPSAGGGGGPFGPAADASLAISGDARWLAFTTYPKAADAKKLRKDRKPLQNGLTLVNVATGEKRDFDKVRRFAFAGDAPSWLVMHRYAAEGAPSADLLLLDLRSGTISTIGSVGEWALDDTGAQLAWTTEVRDQVGNGVQLRHLATDVVRSLDSDKALYRRLTWTDSGFALTVLRGVVDSAASDTAYSIVGWTGNATQPTRSAFAVADVASFPAGLRISPDRAPRWSTDRSAFFFGISARRTGPESKATRPDVRPVAGTPGAMQSPAGAGGSDDDLPSLVIWHGKGDPRLQSQQQVEENRDKQYSYLAEYRLGTKTFLRLATDELREVQLTPRDRFAYGYDRRAYERRDAIDGGQRRDILAIDLATGARSVIRSAAKYNLFPSPDGTKALYYDDGQYHIYDFATKASTPITTGAPTSFVDTEDDHNVDRPPVQPVGWAADNQSVLLFDNYDVWKVGIRGGAFVNLTGNGRKERIRYTRRLVINPKERGIDLAQPVYLQTYGEKTKKEGLARVMPGKAGAEVLLWDDAKFTVNRARNADTWVYTRQTFRDFPDYYVAEKTFAAPRRLTNANPQQADYAWSSGAQLVNYVSDKGDSLQGALFLPANYEPGRKYPTMVYIYEKLSQSLHQYAVPNETRAFNPSVYTSRGYAVLMPDIVYKINDPGMSSVWCVVPAVKAAIATGIVDPAKVGLHGHSWGGYQSSFLATQTGKLFAGIVTGAPLTDMVSMYSSVYWNTGTADMAIFESSQGRFKGSYIENRDAYIRNSPVFFADKVETPVMILHNEKDGAVDFNQGITWFNTLREQGKDVIMLQYVGENHGLQLPKNQKDYTLRMAEYFDHFLMGKPAPEWLRNGIPRLQMEEHLKSRQKKPKVAS
ncbi:MAG: S9 family peptidase [Gemmatimonadaceae bacterium]|nr:S9 family peptidase [Gemmatimonadaceae bacterium]